MRKKIQQVSTIVSKTRTDQARTRAELAKTLKEQVKTRIELTKTRMEQAKTRRELAKTRTEQSKTRGELVKVRKEKPQLQTKQVEKTLQRVVHREFDIHDTQQKKSTTPLKELSPNESAGQKSALERLTDRQRRILQLIAESQNTKQIAQTLQLSSKTVEYHRGKLMTALDVHDVPGLVRFAMRAGLIPPEG